jgi:hypothetical protein
MGYALFAMIWVVPETDDAITAVIPPTMCRVSWPPYFEPRHDLVNPTYLHIFRWRRNYIDMKSFTILKYCHWVILISS